MTRIRFALMLYFFMVAHKAACQTLLKAFLKSMKVLLVLEIFLTEDFQDERLLCGAPSCSDVCLFFSNDLLRLRFSLFAMIFSMILLGWLMRLIIW